MASIIFSAFIVFCLGSLTTALHVVLRNRRRQVQPFPVSALSSGMSKMNPLSGRVRGSPLPTYQLPQGMKADVVRDQVVLTDALGVKILVGENNRGGFGWKPLGCTYWRDNFDTLATAVRHAAYDGFKELSD